MRAETRSPAGSGVSAPWSAADDAALRESYTSGGIEAARIAIPGRTVAAIYHHTERLGLKRRRRWTTSDDTRLRNLWDGEQSLREIANALGRTAATTYWRAQAIGLPLGCPDGWETLTAAAKRAGYSTGTLRHILDREGVAIARRVTRIEKPRGRRRGPVRRCHIVWPADVDAAVASWCAADTLNGHAVRRGIGAEVLRRRLEAAGTTRPKGLGKRHWRMTDDDVDRALAERGAA